ncbi:MAG: adenylate/guanylate cyclase domain-containing protein [Myxococcales bacterium]|nr:adenylate/guanylate cyclase domain-containing protein [Myxococcales bacterium]MBK7191736.1 adenylate/guanylate cyclase domain-containing protein [Myxococcales bacterium]
MAGAPPASDEPHTWTLAFADPAREAAFLDDYAREIRGFYRIALLAVLLLWSASVGFDLQAEAADRTPLFAIRFGAVTPVLVAALVVGFLPWPWFRRLWPTAAAVAYAAVQAGVIGLVAYAPGEMSQLVVGGFLLTVLIGAAMDLARAVRIIGIASLGAVGMGVALARSPSVGTRALWIDLLWIAVAVVGAAVVAVRFEQARRRRWLDRGIIERERERTEALLANLLPPPIAERLKDGHRVIADRLSEVTVLFADLKGFSGLSTRVPPDQLVSRLDRVFSAFDELAREHGLEKIKTIGDAYMAVSGAPAARADHATAAAAMATAMIARLREVEPELELRVGLASGPAVAGVIGRSKYSYDLWGETVNLASRMESHGVAGRVQVAARTRELLGDAVACEARGTIEVKGLGAMPTFLLGAGGEPGA